MRVFRCPSCGSRMRWRGERCTRCYSQKPVLKSSEFYEFIFFGTLFAVTLLLLIRVTVMFG